MDLCEAKGEPYDVLGSIYMELEIGNDHIGQYFTPSEVSNLCAQVVMTDLKKQLEEEGVIFDFRSSLWSWLNFTFNCKTLFGI